MQTNETQNFLLSYNNRSIVDKVKYAKMRNDITAQDIICVIKHIKTEILAGMPKYKRVLKNPKKCHVYNEFGIRIQTDVLDEFDLPIINIQESDAYDYLQRSTELTRQLAHKTMLPVFKNGKLYKQTKIEISKLLN